MKFPNVEGVNLLRQRVSLPGDLRGEINLVFVPFHQWHQALVDSWLPFARQLEQDHPGLCYYELPTIQRMNKLYQTFINEGMRAGIPNSLTRERTITLYLDKQAFRRALNLASEQDIYVLLIDRQGNVLHRAQGIFTPEKGSALAWAAAGWLHARAGKQMQAVLE